MKPLSTQSKTILRRQHKKQKYPGHRLSQANKSAIDFFLKRDNLIKAKLHKGDTKVILFPAFYLWAGSMRGNCLENRV